MKTNTILAGMTMMLLLASAAASEDYTLGIFGNANEDDTINMQDVTYTELIILEYRDRTELADAKYDGKINMQDVTQIELIILGRELELTLIDSADGTVMVNKPVNRVVTIGWGADCEALRALKAKEKVVGVHEQVTRKELFFPELSELPVVCSSFHPDTEKILELGPDLVIVLSTMTLKHTGELVDAGISVACLNMYKRDGLEENLIKLGYIIGKREEAEEFIDFIQESEAEIDEKVKEFLPDDDDRLRVYMEGARGDYVIVGTTSPYNRFCELAGGINIATEADIPGCVNVDPEWVVGQNPDIIFKMVLAGYPASLFGYETDDPSGMKEVRDDIMNRPGLANIEAVKSGRVYVMYCLALSPGNCVGIPYMAKAIYPNIFSDLDPKEIHQRYVTEFQGLDFDVYEHGVFVYPSLEES